MHAQADISQLPEILRGIQEEHRQELQDQLRKVWQKFRYTSADVIESASKSVTAVNLKQSEQLEQELPELQDDALHTILQFLHGKMSS